VTEARLRKQYLLEYPRLERLATEIMSALRDLFKDDERIALIEARVKRPPSFLRKAAARDPAGAPKYPVPLIDIQDQIGCRIVVRSPRFVPEVIAMLQLHYNSIENQARPAHLDPATFGYEAWHLICLVPPRKDASVKAQTFEIQISTPFQYAWAVMEHDLLYKPGGGTANYEQQRAVHAAAALAYAADQLFDLAQPGARSVPTPSARARLKPPPGERRLRVPRTRTNRRTSAGVSKCSPSK